MVGIAAMISAPTMATCSKIVSCSVFITVFSRLWLAPVVNLGVHTSERH
jgi:hypothetical protein